MTLTQRLSLIWRRFSPLEERLLATVRGVLPPDARPILDAQVSAITHVQRCLAGRRLTTIAADSARLIGQRSGDSRLRESSRWPVCASRSEDVAIGPLFRVSMA